MPMTPFKILNKLGNKSYKEEIEKTPNTIQLESSSKENQDKNWNNWKNLRINSKFRSATCELIGTPNTLYKNRDDFALVRMNSKSVMQKKPPTRRMSSVVSTKNVRRFKNSEDGKKMINQYSVIKTLGQGSFATVKLCEDSNTKI
jgi:hypothetical protein